LVVIVYCKTFIFTNLESFNRICILSLPLSSNKNWTSKKPTRNAQAEDKSCILFWLTVAKWKNKYKLPTRITCELLRLSKQACFAPSSFKLADNVFSTFVLFWRFNKSDYLLLLLFSSFHFSAKLWCCLWQLLSIIMWNLTYLTYWNIPLLQLVLKEVFVNLSLKWKSIKQYIKGWITHHSS